MIAVIAVEAVTAGLCTTLGFLIGVLLSARRIGQMRQSIDRCPRCTELKQRLSEWERGDYIFHSEGKHRAHMTPGGAHNE